MNACFLAFFFLCSLENASGDATDSCSANFDRQKITLIPLDWECVPDAGYLVTKWYATQNDDTLDEVLFLKRCGFDSVANAIRIDKEQSRTVAKTGFELMCINGALCIVTILAKIKPIAIVSGIAGIASMFAYAAGDAAKDAQHVNFYRANQIAFKQNTLWHQEIFCAFPDSVVKDSLILDSLKIERDRRKDLIRKIIPGYDPENIWNPNKH